jgi:hypothetical protein
MKKNYKKLLNYCQDGESDMLLCYYYIHNINVRDNKDCIFTSCCKLTMSLNPTSEKYYKLIEVLLLLCTFCRSYYLKLENKILMSWSINDRIIITI